MKLLIIATCIVAGGKVKNRGDIYDTKEEDKTADKEAFTLISAGRALDFASDADEVKTVRAQIEKEAAEKAALAKAADDAAKKADDKSKK